MSFPFLVDEKKKKKKNIKFNIGRIPESIIQKIPKINILQVDDNPSDCVSILSSCYETDDPLGCSFGRMGMFFSCITSGSERLVTNVPCKGEEVGTHYMPYSVYKDWLGCTNPQSGGEAECDTFTKIDSSGREITTKVQCECPEIKEWNGQNCVCPEERPFDPLDMENSGSQMIGNCCAVATCGEGGVYDCETDECDCAPGWYKDSEGGCRDDPCTPGPFGGEGCGDEYCCAEIGSCVENIGQWDGQGDPDAPKTIPECEDEEGKWITTDPNDCPESGHCKLSICDLNRSYVENEFVISECDPDCSASKCALACSEADETKCGGDWVFDSCDNKGTPSSCLCACVPSS